MIRFTQELSIESATGRRWVARLENGRRVPWRGLETGPLTLTPAEIERLSIDLLGRPTSELAPLADRVLVPALGKRAKLPALLLHSTTPDLKTFDGDLDALLNGQQGGDFTTYKEARSVYLGRPGDIAVGRTGAWRSAVRALGSRAIRLEDCDHYYLSHALLALAASHRHTPRASLHELIAVLHQEARVIRLYAFELEMQIFLLWLAQEAGLEELAVEANRPAISAAWNRKEVLHPTLERALDLGTDLPADPHARLALEGRLCRLAIDMGLVVPRVPGYSIERKERSQDDFVHQTLRAAELLQSRHGLSLGCLKASESGDGARITPGLVLADHETLAELAGRSHRHGDDYVLEAHVRYGRAEIAGQTLPTALSAHIRGGEVAPAATLQFVEGTSWKGNVLLDAESAPLFGVRSAHYQELRAFLGQFHAAFKQRAPGLVLAGIDFAAGRVGGLYGEEVLFGVQDLNISFTGAECLRSFLEKVKEERGEAAQACGVTRIFRPVPSADHHDFLRITKQFNDDAIFADTVAAIPGRWGMVGITGQDPRDAISNLNRLQAALEEARMIPCSE